MKNTSLIKGFTLIELLVVISIIALLSSVVVAAVTKSRVKARDSARIQNARQLAVALEQYEQSNETYRISDSGLNNEGIGYASKGSETDGYSTSIVSALKSAGYYTSDNLLDPVYGTDNYYVGLCESTNAYNVFVKLEQTEYDAPTSAIERTCGGIDAVSEGFSFIGSTAGGSAGALVPSSTGGFAGAYEEGMGPETEEGESGGETGGGGGGPISLATVSFFDDTFHRGLGADDMIYKIQTLSDGKIIFCGGFMSYDGLPLKRIVRLNSDGTIDDTFNIGTGPDNGINSFAVQPDGKIIIGGGFFSYNATPITRIARLNTNGSLDTTFNPGVGPNSGINDIVLQQNGKIIIVGYFDAYNNITKNAITRLNSDGTPDTTFDPGIGANQPISQAFIQPDGKIIIIGAFTSYNGTEIKKIARLNIDGSLDTTFSPGSGVVGSISSALMQPDGKMIIVGMFFSYNGTPVRSVARLNSDGSLDVSFDPGSGAGGILDSVAIQSDGKILISGDFDTFNDYQIKYIARLNSNGSLDPTFNLGSALNTLSRIVTVQPNGKILFEADFESSVAGYLMRVQ